MPRTDNGRRVVVAGATGYLGKYAVQALQRKGWRVRALARPSCLGDAAIACDEVFTGQATRPETLAGLFVGANRRLLFIGVRHFRRKPTFEEVDFGANATLVAAAAEAGVKRFVFVSILDGQRLRTLRRSSTLVNAWSTCWVAPAWKPSSSDPQGFSTTWPTSSEWPRRVRCG